MINIPSKYVGCLENWKYIDLFCGIGVFYQALNSYGATCVYSIDIDKHASKVYEDNYGINPYGDITKVNVEDIPEFDILCAGFPCQSFSISGKQLGFNDTRGTLFFDILRIVSFHKPKVILLENVSNLKRHDEGKTFKIIKSSLENEGYTVYDEVLNSGKYGIPQSRRRIYLVCIRNDLDFTEYVFPKEFSSNMVLDDVLLGNIDMSDYIIDKEAILDEKNTQYWWKYSKTYTCWYS